VLEATRGCCSHACRRHKDRTTMGQRRRHCKWIRTQGTEDVDSLNELFHVLWPGPLLSECAGLSHLAALVARLPPLRVWCSSLLLCVSLERLHLLSCVYVPPPRFFAHLSPRSFSLSWLYNKEITPLGGKDRPAHTHAPCTQTHLPIHIFTYIQPRTRFIQPTTHKSALPSFVFSCIHRWLS